MTDYDDVIAAGSMEDLEAALEQFRELATNLALTERTAENIKSIDDE